MSKQHHSSVHLFVGKMADAEALENYLTGSYDEDGEYVASAFEEHFELDLDPDFLKKGWFEPASSDLQELLTGFSYDGQIKPQFPETLPFPINSLVLVYQTENAPIVRTEEQLIYLGQASYVHS